MPRVKRAVNAKKKRRKVFKLAKGFFGSRHRLLRTATEAVDRAMALSYAHRKEKKRDFRGLWIVRLSAACKLNEISYSRFIEGLTKAGVELNRKMLSEIAIHDPEGFASLAALAKSKATIPAKAK
ncbi:MAG TPA: 50S ribosomal protein L20 [Kiritimatiellia bacterium]|nr:50S ribosomal protein L20 [Kiritimatiellia bacterium]